MQNSNRPVTDGGPDRDVNDGQMGEKTHTVTADRTMAIPSEAASAILPAVSMLAVTIL